MRLKIGTAVLAASLALAGCSASATASAPAGSGSAAAGQTIRILAEGGGVGLQTGIAEQFTKDTGIKVEFVEVPYADVHDKLAADISTGAGSYDLATIDVIWMTEFGPSLENLDDVMTPEVTADLPAALVADAKFEDHFIGMPQWANAEILFYRKDLFEDAGEQKAFKAQFGYDLVPPRTGSSTGTWRSSSTVRRTSCTGPRSRARWRPNGSPTSSRPGRRRSFWTTRAE